MEHIENDVNRARERLSQGTYTLVLVNGARELVSDKSGISPMLDFLRSGEDMRGFSAADKIVGKAAALLFVLAGIKEVYAEVLSEEGRRTLERHSIPAEWNKLVSQIVNREGVGVCPMERAVKDIDEPKAAYAALSEAREALRAKKP